MLRRIDLRTSSAALEEVLPRPTSPSDGPVDAVREILARVRVDGDAAVRAYTERFDGVSLDTLVVDEGKIEAAIDFIRGGGRVVVISDPPHLEQAVAGETGTRIVPWPNPGSPM